MEPKLRPIPITILDFFAILLPGTVWALLIAAAREAIMANPCTWTEAPTPLLGWAALSSFLGNGQEWRSGLAFLVIALLIGYIVKPVAMPVAAWFSKFLLRRMKGTQVGVTGHPVFPFSTLFKPEFLDPVKDLVKRRAGLDAETLPRNQPFSAAKRFLRLAAPELWEESERMETEVRMIGALLLAAVCSSILNAVFFAIGLFLSKEFFGFTLAWALASFLIVLLLSHEFNKLRYREVSYTYINALLADKRLTDYPPQKR